MQWITYVGKKHFFVLQSRGGIDLKTFTITKAFPEGQMLLNVAGEVDLGSKIPHYLTTRIDKEHGTSTVGRF